MSKEFDREVGAQMEVNEMTNEQYQDAVNKTVKTTLLELLIAIQDENDPEVIKGKIREKIKEVS